ncbi:MAG: RNA 2',3'-cyclic phosphodiesterase [Sphingobium sp.]
MHRLFVAIRPPVEVRTQLLAAMGGVPGARWQTDDQLHLTLRFIGEVDRHGANDIADALATIRFAPFEIALSGVGCFRNGAHVNALWAGIQPRDRLDHLHAKVDRACVRAGSTADDRAYMPHITLARMSRSAGAPDAFLTHHAGLASAPFTVDEFILYESHLGGTRARYRPVDRYPAHLGK